MIYRVMTLNFKIVVKDFAGNLNSPTFAGQFEEEGFD